MSFAHEFRRILAKSNLRRSTITLLICLNGPANADDQLVPYDDEIIQNEVGNSSNARSFITGVVRQVLDGNLLEVQVGPDASNIEKIKLLGEIHDTFGLQFLLLDRVVDCELFRNSDAQYSSALCRLDISSDRLPLSSIFRFLEEFEIIKK